MQMEFEKISGAEAIMRSLICENVDTVFGYPGGAIMPLYDALYNFQEKVNHILVRHEQGAVHAAQGYARASGKTGVCFATSGPGATNLITGLADAMCDSTSVVCITGQVASHLLGTDAFQETDIISISNPVTKWNFQVTKPEDIPSAIAKAFYISKTGRPGPVLLDITKDAQNKFFEFSYTACTRIRSYNPYPKLNKAALEEAARLINSAQKPFLLAGQGVLLADAEDELLELAEKSGIPVASTLLGLSALPVEHPQYVGFLGMHGNCAPNIKTNECDLLIAVGMCFDDRVTGDASRYAKQAKVIHIEIDPSEINKIINADVAINADAKEALSALTPLIESRRHDKWIDEFRQCEKQEHEQVIRPAIDTENGPIKMSEAVHILSQKASENTIIVTDVGQHQMITARYFRYKSRKSNITSGGLGTMGFALPAAMGAKIGAPDREVIAIIGDGGIQMTLQELGTIAQSNIPVKIIILNNNYLGMVRQWQELFFEKRYSFTELTNPSFTAIAEGYGIATKSVSERTCLHGAIDEMLAYKGAFLLEVIVEQEENVFPMVSAGASVSEVRLQ
jgi:acetolactate synthase-1/2/3 large subunit